MTQPEKMKVYIAAPFFSKEQLDFVKHIESECDRSNIDYFSPRSFGVLKDMTLEEKKQHMGKIYNKNIEEMEKCSVMIAVIDDYDVGTMFEIGYYTSLMNFHKGFLPRWLISVTDNDHGLNIMLQNSIDVHLKDKEAISPLLVHYINHGGITEFIDFNQFNIKDVT